jgi:hydroxyquinol 1,2-dioxygenase
MRHIDEDTITQAVIARHAGAADARLREVMTSLVQHLHAFARDVKLTEAEWLTAIRFLTEAGEITDAQRQEFVLLSDTLGLSMLVTALNHRKPKGCTEASWFGPFHAAGTASAHAGKPLVQGAQGAPCFVQGRVLGLGGTPIPGAEVQFAGGPGHLERGVLSSGADGGFRFRSLLAEPYPIPHDGPVGRLLEALGRHPWRPAHLHFMVTAPGYEPLVTHVFREGDRYLDSDAVFGVRQSLITDWVRHEPGRTPDGATSSEPFYTFDFDFVLNKATAS